MGNMRVMALLLQVTRRWLNFEGVAVPCHLAQQLQLMEALVAPAVTQEPAAAAAATGGQGFNEAAGDQQRFVNGQASTLAAGQDAPDAAVV
jgi:hypothetical protein